MIKGYLIDSAPEATDNTGLPLRNIAQIMRSHCSCTVIYFYLGENISIFGLGCNLNSTCFMLYGVTWELSNKSCDNANAREIAIKIQLQALIGSGPSAT